MRQPRLVSWGAVVLALSACGGGPTGPSPNAPALTLITTTAHYRVFAAPGDSVDTAWQEQYYAWVLGALQLEPTPPLEYRKYLSREHLEALTGRSTNGFAETNTLRFHTIWPIDNHEGVHTLVMLQIGHPPPLFNEGVAVAHQTFPDRGRVTPTWNGTDLHVLARQHDAAGRLPPLASLLDPSGFFAFDTNVTYPSAGSFVRYLLDSDGLAPFKAYVASATFTDVAATTEIRFLAAYGRPLAERWQEWRDWLRP